MNIVYLFNADDKKFNGYYGIPILIRILSSNILQSANRHLRVLTGDLLAHINSNTQEEREVIYKKLFDHPGLKNFTQTPINEITQRTNICLYLIQNIEERTALDLDQDLKSDSSYLGFQSVDLTFGLHFILFYNLIIDTLRLQGNECKMFYSMGEEDTKDIAIAEELAEMGLQVEFEDTGARKTIFDNYEDTKYFERMGDFQKLIAPHIPGGLLQAEDISLYLEDIHPQLFDTLASALRVLENAETIEDRAQAALSGRRFIEKLANALFPPQTNQVKGKRNLNNASYKNRLWAYIEETLKKTGQFSDKKLVNLGKEVDRLDVFFNKGLHDEIEKSELWKAFADLNILTSQIIALSPSESRRPYSPYLKEIEKLNFI